MVRSGEKLNSKSLFTFTYSGREPRTVSKFLDIRPDFRDLYIYDINLSTGRLLYECRGGMGVTTEPYIVDMHKFLSTSTCVRSLETELSKNFGTSKYRSYYRLREAFNNRTVKLASWSDHAQLYWLWAFSGFTHRYEDLGYKGIYCPTQVDLERVSVASRTSREKNLLFRKENMFTFSESIINDNMVLYAHLPAQYGRHGSRNVWTEKKFCHLVRELKELSLLGYKVCVSALFKKRGRVLINYPEVFDKFNHTVISKFKDTELGPSFCDSDIYLYNF
jgi:hypothetical protein